MRFIKFNFRRVDIFLIPFVGIVIYGQYYFISQNYNESQEKKLEKRLEKLAQECRDGKQGACNEYTLILEKVAPK
ncbi:hypothetical protein CQA53_07190 [Helicobacter didelphidarum]|uniref:Uncharacterized protein n=1 Tax=Helicobacter didelphidarum TaxID=2040648 RepID=A0A3D8IIJ0_9HELI|nr:hypothetical protein [Helicobacter didelphidarum]RDU64933.1 hypothetical protein CQA53_07190 [Helicobacter didelphidarum]